VGERQCVPRCRLSIHLARPLRRRIASVTLAVTSINLGPVAYRRTLREKASVSLQCFWRRRTSRAGRGRFRPLRSRPTQSGAPPSDE
jgi:hypothetical protein